MKVKNTLYKNLMALALFAGVIGITACTGSTDQEHELSPSVRQFYESRFQDQHKSWQSMSDWKGQLLIVNFWATWCAPCRDEMPELSQLHDDYQPMGVAVLGIATEDSNKIKEFSKTTHVSYPLLAGEYEATELAVSLGNTRGGLPYTVVISKSGEILGQYLGRISKAEIEGLIQQALSAPT